MVYRFQDFEADAAIGCLRHGGREIGLRRKSFQVLAVLLEHRDRLVTREELFARVWPDTAVTDVVLDGVISELRKTLQDNPKSPVFIKTMPRAGYRFIAPVETTEPGQRPPEVLVPARIRATSRLWLFVGAAGGLFVLASGAALSLWHTPKAVEEHLEEVAWWRFDESGGNAILDSSGYGNQGRIDSGVTRVPGRMGGALRFDGLGDGVAGKSGSLMPAGDSPRTIAAWPSSFCEMSSLQIFRTVPFPRASDCALRSRTSLGAVGVDANRSLPRRSRKISEAPISVIQRMASKVANPSLPITMTRRKLRFTRDKQTW